MNSLIRVMSLSALAAVLVGCTTVYGLRVPLASEPVSPRTSDIVIDDRRPAPERKVHVAFSMSTCERWLGDETFVPSRVEYLRNLLAQRAGGQQLRIQLSRFETMENCQNTAKRHKAGAIAAASATASVAASGSMTFSRTLPYDDPTVRVRLAGEINGAPFDLMRTFTYGDLEFKGMPGTNPVYADRMRAVMSELADELVAKVSRAAAATSSR